MRGKKRSTYSEARVKKGLHIPKGAHDMIHESGGWVGFAEQTARLIYGALTDANPSHSEHQSRVRRPVSAVPRSPQGFYSKVRSNGSCPCACTRTGVFWLFQGHKDLSFLASVSSTSTSSHLLQNLADPFAFRPTRHTWPLLAGDL